MLASRENEFFGRAPHGYPPRHRSRNEEEFAMRSARLALMTMALVVGALTPAAGGATAPPQGNAPPPPDNAVLLTVFFKHDQSRPLNELNAQLDKQGFDKAFPPPGIEVVSWYVMMGIGQVITLRLPASRLREVNRVIEDTAWGAYRTEFYSTYDYKAVGMTQHDKAAAN